MDSQGIGRAMASGIAGQTAERLVGGEGPQTMLPPFNPEGALELQRDRLEHDRRVAEDYAQQCEGRAQIARVYAESCSAALARLEEVLPAREQASAAQTLASLS